MADFFDAAGQYLMNRFNQASMPFTNPSGYFDQRMNSRFGDMYETEEEKRRREELERQQRLVSGPVAPATAPTPGLTESEVTPGYKPQPFKQTLTIDPATGQQRLKVEGDPRDFTAANANTPTLTMPSTPMAPAGTLGPSDEELLREQEQRRQYDMMMARPAGPVAPPQAPVQMAAAPATTQTDVTAPTTGMVAAPAAAPVAPVSPDQQYEAQGLQEGPMGRQPQVQKNWLNILTAAARDPNALQRIQDDPDTPDMLRPMLANIQSGALTQQKQESQAPAQLQAAIAQGKINDILKNQEGSYLKAYLFARLGLNDLAQAEQAKLRSIWQQTTDGKGNPALIKTVGGIPTEGYDSQFQPISADRLISFAGGVGKFKPEIGNVYVKRDAQGNVVARGVRTTQVTAQNKTISKIESNGELFDFDQTWEPEPISTAVARQQQLMPGRYTESYVTGVGGAQGRAAGEGLQVGPAPAAPGVGGLPGAAPSGATPTAPAAPSGAPGAAPVTTGPAVTGSTPNIPAPRGGIPSVPAQRAGVERGQKRGESFDKIVDTEYREDARKGDLVSSNRRDQFAILERRDPVTGTAIGEQIAGLYNAASQDPTNQKLTIIRDIMLGKVGLPEDEVSRRVAQLNISEAAKSALLEYNAMNARIAAQSLRETAGPGSVSDAEQAANRAANVDITKTPLLGVYQMMARSQFGADIQRYKADLAANSTDRYSNATQFDRDFRKIQSSLSNTYREIATKRLDFITRNGSSPEAIREAYRRYPVPQYDPNLNNGQGGWRYLKPIGEILQ